jgi:hypothetical protein
MQVDSLIRKIGLKSNWWIVALCTLFVLVLLSAQNIRSGWCNDESAHIPAGLYHLETGRMDAYRVNPPLFRMLAAVPLLVAHPKMDWFSYDSLRRRNEYVFAQNWIQDNLSDVPLQLRLARSVIILYFLLGAWTIFRWTSELYGSGAGWLALAMWSLSPDVITYSATVAPDLPAAATGLFACYMFWKWLYGGKSEIPWGVCLGLALATLSKFSWLFLFVLFPILTLLYDLICRKTIQTIVTGYGTAGSEEMSIDKKFNSVRFRFASTRIAKLGIAFLGTLLLINVVYGFEGTGRRLGDFEFLSVALGGERESSLDTGNRFRGTLLGSTPLPIPCEMLQGMDYVKWEFEQGMSCYLLGEWKFRGWWYYYLVAMAVKMPIGYFVLIAFGFGAMVARVVQRRSVGGEWIVPLVALLFIAQVSSQTGFTHHLRYVLPSFGFLFIFASGCIRELSRRLATIVIVSSFVGIIAFHATHIGLAHTHFNWLAGGSRNGWRHLSLSNIDWGQSTFRIADWARAHLEKRPLTVLFVSERGGPSKLISDLGVSREVRWQDSPSDSGEPIPNPGWYLMSVQQLTHQQNMYFRNAKPDSWPFDDVVLFYVPDDPLR